MDTTSTSSDIDGIGWRWESAPHEDLSFFGIPVPYPWPRDVPAVKNPEEDSLIVELINGIKLFQQETGEDKDSVWSKIPVFAKMTEDVVDCIEHADLDGMEAKLLEMGELLPGTAYVACNLGFIAKARGKTEDSLRLFAEAVRIAPDRVHGWKCYAEELEASGDMIRAAECFEKALALNPKGDAVIMEGLVRTGRMKKVHFKNEDGSFTVSYGRMEAFIETMRENIRRCSDPKDPDAAENLKWLIRAAEQFISTDEHDLALMAAKGVMKHDPQVTEHRLLMIQALIANQEIEKARRMAKALCNQEPSNADARLELARCHSVHSGKLWRQGLLETLELDPNHYGALMLNFGLTFDPPPSGSYQQCLAWSEAHGSGIGIMIVSRNEAEQGNAQTALELAEKAYKLTPKNRSVFLNYIEMLASAEETEWTAALLKPRLAANERDAEMLWHYAGAMRTLGLKDEAIKVLERGLKLEPEEMNQSYRQRFSHTLDELRGQCAIADVELELMAKVFNRSLVYHFKEGMAKEIFGIGRVSPCLEEITLEFARPRERVIVEMQQGMYKADHPPLSLGCFLIEGIDEEKIETGKVTITVYVDEKFKLKAWAHQDKRKLMISWHAYPPIGVHHAFSEEEF